MPKAKPVAEPQYVTVGWQGVTAEIPDDWNIGAISGDKKQGYVRFDDDTMARLEIKWASQTGFVDLEKVVSKYLADIEKARGKSRQPIEIEPDIKLISRRRRKRASQRCFHWKAEIEAYGAAWVCKDCGRTMISQVSVAPEDDPEAARELAASVLLSITDHATAGWALWSAYGLSAWVPDDFALSGQKLMAGLIELEFERGTEKLKVARWGMANVALKKKSFQDWLGGELSKTFRKQSVRLPEETQIKGHPGLAIEGGKLKTVQTVQCFLAHCTGKLYADRFIARAWHCDPTNRILYVEGLLDRSHIGLPDEVAERIECHPEPQKGA